MKNLLFTIILLLFVYTNYAQLTYEKRLEFELKDGYGGETILDFGSDGMILRSQKIENLDGEKEIKFDSYSTDLEVEESVSFMIEEDYYISKTLRTENRIHTIFRTKKGDYKVHTIRAGSLNQHSASFLLPRTVVIKASLVVGTTIYFNTQNKKSFEMYAVDWTNGNVKVIPVSIDGFKWNRVRSLNMQTVEGEDEAILFLRAVVSKKEADIYAMHFDGKGNLMRKYRIKEPEGKNFIGFTASKIGDDHYILSGTFSSGSVSTSEGLFFAELEGQNLNYAEFYNFIDLENFFTYLSEKSQEKIAKKKEKKANRGQELKVNYFIAEHKVIVLDDGYLFLGEVYYPTYRTEYYTTVVNGQTVTRTRQVFDGYQYTHAVLAKFNKYGQMQWDQVFEMYPTYKPMSVKRFIQIAEGEQDALNLVFSNRSTIVSKSFSYDGEVIYDKTSEPIETNLEGDQTKQSFSSISYWYDNYFLAYGSQVIKNNEEEKKKRKVYFISKIKFE